MEISQNIKVRRDRHGYEINEAMICYTTQKETEEANTQINKGTEWHAEIYQNRYTKINKGRKKRANENHNNEESERNKTNSERQNQKSRKGLDKWQEEMDILKSDVSQIKEYIKTIMDNKEWLKNSQNDKEGKQNQKENKEKKGKASKKENTKIKEDKKWTTKTSRWQSTKLTVTSRSPYAEGRINNNTRLWDHISKW